MKAGDHLLVEHKIVVVAGSAGPGVPPGLVLSGLVPTPYIHAGDGRSDTGVEYTTGVGVRDCARSIGAPYGRALLWRILEEGIPISWGLSESNFLVFTGDEDIARKRQSGRESGVLLTLHCHYGEWGWGWGWLASKSWSDWGRVLVDTKLK